MIVNNSTGVVTVQSSGANTITLIPANASVRCTCILITGTTTASWSFAFEGNSNIPYKQIPTITATVATNILTLGLNPCALDFRSSTASSGATTTRNVTAAISMTVSNGSTLGTSSGALSRFAVLAIDNAGTVELAVVNANTYKILDERVLISTTAEGGTGTADSGTVIYSTTARTSVPFRIVGYVESTQATAGAYASSPSNIAGAGGSISAGTVIQVVSTTKNDIFSSSSTSFTDITGLSVSITPTSLSSKILVLVSSNYGTGGGSQLLTINLVRGATNIATPNNTGLTDSGTAVAYQTTSDQVANYSINFLDSPATTSATTYKVQAKVTGNTFYVNGRNSADLNTVSTITVMEIAA